MERLGGSAIAVVAFTAWGTLACGGASGGTGFRPPGSCETPRPPRPQELAGLERFPGGGAERSLLVDLDGDGAADRLVSTDGLCDRHGNCGYRVYLMRGSCGHALGAVWAHRVRTGRTGKGVIADLVATTRDDQGEFEEWYRWGEGEYECELLRERATRSAGRLDPGAVWGPWEPCQR